AQLDAVITEVSSSRDDLSQVPSRTTKRGKSQLHTSSEKVSHAKAQRRKALPRFNRFRCAFAPLREKYFFKARTRMLLCRSLQTPVAPALFQLPMQYGTA